MKKIKEWFKKHKYTFKKIFGWLICILLAIAVFFEGYICGMRKDKHLTASAEALTYGPSDYHYPLKVGVVVDNDTLLYNGIPNAVTYFPQGEAVGGVSVTFRNDYNNLYNELLSPINVIFSGTANSDTVINKIELQSKYFQYVSYPLLSLGVSQSDIQNSYAIYINEHMFNSLYRVYCSYQYNINTSDRVVTVVNQVLEPYSLRSAMSQYPSQYQYNAFTLFPSQPFGSPSYEGVYLINPFKSWDDNEELSEIFVANIYNFTLTIEFEPFVIGDYVRQYQHMFTYCSFLYDYSADFPTRVVTRVSWLESVADSVDSFLSINILPDFSFYDILLLCVVIPLVVAILIAWLGG